jgi:hypothetical protein
MTYGAASRVAQARIEAQRRQAAARRMVWAVSVMLAAVVVAAVVVLWHVYTSSTRDVTAVVVDKSRVCDGTGSSVSCYYLIFTDVGTFKDTDSLVAGKFASSDMYGQLQLGHAYRLQVRGYRIPVLSEYPNILKIEGEVQ